MSSEAFDPYRQWLTIEDPARPLDHYTLLGIERLESDPRAITQAADKQMAKVRRIRPGERLGDWGRLLDQLEAVKVCLLDPVAKAVYDAGLQGLTPARNNPLGTVAVATSFEPPPPEPLAPPVGRFTPVSAPLAIAIPRPETVAAGTAPNDAALGVTAGAEKSSSSGKGRALGRLLIVGVLLLVLAGLGVAFNEVLNRPPAKTPLAQHTVPSPQDPKPSTSPPNKPSPPSSQPSVEQPPRTPVVQDPAVVENPAVVEETPVSPPVVQRRPAVKKPSRVEAVEEPSGKVIDRRKRAAFKAAILAARDAMSHRDLILAKKQLAKAKKNVQTNEELREWDRLETIREYLGQFWEGISESMSGLQGGEEMVVGKTRVAVVEASADAITLRVSGRNRSYTIQRMPLALVKHIGSWAFTGDPASKVFVGTFFLMDADGDPEQARKLWKEAVSEGIKMGDLMQELDHK